VHIAELSQHLSNGGAEPEVPLGLDGKTQSSRNLSELMNLMREIDKDIHQYLEIGWWRRFASSKRFVQRFEEFHKDLIWWVSAVHLELGMRTKQDVGDIKRGVDQLTGSMSDIKQDILLLLEDQRKAYAKDAGTCVHCLCQHAKRAAV